ncbi:MAG: nickel pincer cofactor biosynthesis protein LarB [Nitrososphaerota archaeon]|nr:nickel pincer cofactor biosynthesis protein LarB [Aigarchaeota archaeon]MDW8077172.1 nickel pincer cofactor biosynthesis protein LarB [Nitrososphaerota archaeon]
MNLREILTRFSKGQLTINDAEKLIKLLAIQEVSNFARLDVGRELRKDIPELILAEGKTDEQLSEIINALLGRAGRVIVTRLQRERYNYLITRIPEDCERQYNELARILIVRAKGYPRPSTGGKVGILTAGTHDVPVAEEARVVAEEMGCTVKVFYDVGVAGIHRLFEPLKTLLEWDADVIVVVAGREGALPSVVGSLVDVPIIAVPTSSGYGYGGRGKTALMAMLQSCSLGIGVVNIDGGVPAGVLSALIANRAAKFRT